MLATQQFQMGEHVGRKSARWSQRVCDRTVQCDLVSHVVLPHASRTLMLIALAQVLYRLLQRQLRAGRST